ncbi:MAG: helix-turn-helix transcriptional regulator [Acidobacteriota bacterium]|jgi:ribosome-binding protein aMBF1 (putative translation factor)
MVADIIRMGRAKQRWSQTTLGVKVGKYQRFISDIETGKRRPTQEELARICRVLKVDAAVLQLSQGE